ncbi:MAG: hypothetical protein NT166_09815 [Candidatus Aminicenantes bacterium]|nr:hypothetical protein [Candidatus Aminicenantes bacterium]
MWTFKKKIKRVLKKDFSNETFDEIKSILNSYNAKVLKEELGTVGLISFYSLKFKIGKEKLIFSSISDEEGISLIGKEELVNEIANRIENF